MTKTIYKFDTKGNCRIWRMEVDGNRYRTVSGLEDGKQTVSKWTEAKAKRGTTPDEQALLEVASKYEHKLTREYHKTKEEAKGGAHFFKPMLAKTYSGLPLWEDLYAQPKLDGMRCIATKEGLFSRQGKPILGCPHIVEALEEAFSENPDLILDGELYNHKLKEDFNKLMSLCKKQDPTAEELAESKAMVEYHIYDVPSFAHLSFSTRLNKLGNLFIDYEWDTPIVEVYTVAILSLEGYNTFHGECVEAGYEGSMLRLDKGYEQKRSKNLLKRKDFLDDEFEVVKLVEGDGNWTGAVKSVAFQVPGAAINYGDLFWEDGKLQKYINSVSPGAGAVRVASAGVAGSYERGVELLEGPMPRVVKVRYFEKTPDGVPRFGVVIIFYEGERDD